MRALYLGLACGLALTASISAQTSPRPATPAQPASPATPAQPGQVQTPPATPTSPATPTPGSPATRPPGSPATPTPGSPATPAPGSPATPSPMNPAQPGQQTPGSPATPPTTPGTTTPGTPAPGTTTPGTTTPGTTTPRTPTPGTTTPGTATPGTAAQPGVANTYPNSLYRMNDVSKALNFTPEQMNRLNTLTQQMQTQYRDNYTNLGNVTPAERFARAQALNQQYYNDWNKAAGNILTDSQRGRYQQLHYQYGGFNTLYDPAVQKQLNLTPAQITDLRAQSDWNNQQMQDVSRLGATDPARGTQAYKDYWTQRQERFNRFLTPDQQKVWLQMTGDPYTFQPEFTTPSP